MSLLARALDASVLFSFDRSGYERHARRFVAADTAVSMTGKSVLVTGATSGLGLAAARSLAALGATVHLLGRDEARGRAAVEAIAHDFPSAELVLHRLDVSLLADVRRFTEGFRGPVDVLINNAGVLPLRLERTREGHELAFATNVLGPFALTQALLPKLVLSHGRVITVSSGGMLLAKLSLPVLRGEVDPFDGVTAYAQTKRAEVILTELWAAQHPDVTFSSMHPGWADTPGVQASLPAFHRALKARLRTPVQGADTITWLAVTPRLAGKSGLFWFDREPVATHLVALTREREADRQALWELCERLTR